MEELKPCPFCGNNDASLISNYSTTKNKYYTYVKCLFCSVQTRGFASAQEADDRIKLRAVNAWNMRCNS